MLYFYINDLTSISNQPKITHSYGIPKEMFRVPIVVEMSLPDNDTLFQHMGLKNVNGLFTAVY
jgi:hypothetical protein